MHVSSSFSISSNLIDEPIFLYNKNPQNLIIDSFLNFTLLTEKIQLEMRAKFEDIEMAAVKERTKAF